MNFTGEFEENDYIFTFINENGIKDRVISNNKELLKNFNYRNKRIDMLIS